MRSRNTGTGGSESIESEIRELSARMKELLQRVEGDIDDQHQHATATRDVDEMQRLEDADPYRWLADAKHSLQAGVMFLERAVSQPINF